MADTKDYFLDREGLAYFYRRISKKFAKNVTVNGVGQDDSGAITVDSVAHANTATEDEYGNRIAMTYATKKELSDAKLNGGGGNTPTPSLSGYIKTINGLSADSNGNITITQVDKANSATTAATAAKADTATNATSATKAGSADNADHANKADLDSDGNNIVTTYATKKELSDAKKSFSGGGSSGGVKQIFNTVQELKVTSGLPVDSYVQTLGYYNYGDEGTGTYRIATASENEWDVPLADGKFAILSNNDRVTYAMFGAKLDGKTDDEKAIMNAHAYANVCGAKVENHHGTIYKKSPAVIRCLTSVDLSGSNLIMDDNNTAFFSWWKLGDCMESQSVHEFDMSTYKSQLTAGTSGINFADNGPQLPQNVVVKLSEDPYMTRNDSGNRYNVDRTELFVHDVNGICTGPLIDDWVNSGNRTLPGTSDKSTFICTYSAIPKNTLTFVGCEVHIKVSAKTQVGLIQCTRHNVVIRDFTIIVDPESMHNIQLFKAAIFYLRECYDVTLENIISTNLAGFNTAEAKATSGYVFDANCAMKILIRHCHFNGYWGSTCMDNIKDVHIEDCTTNRIDVHNYFRDLYIRDVTLQTHGIQIGYGSGICSIENVTCSYQPLNGMTHPNAFLEFNNSYGQLFHGMLSINNLVFEVFGPGGDSDSNPVLCYLEFNDGAACVDESIKQTLPEMRFKNICFNVHNNLPLYFFEIWGTASSTVYNPRLISLENIICNQDKAYMALVHDGVKVTTANTSDVVGSKISIQNVPGFTNTATWIGSGKSPTVKNYDA